MPDNAKKGYINTIESYSTKINSIYPNYLIHTLSGGLG